MTDKAGMSIRHNLLGGSLWLAASFVGAQTPAPSLSLDQALQAATQHPQVQASERQAQAARADVQSANRAPAPTLSAGLSSIDLQRTAGQSSGLSATRMDKSVGLDWTWERGNKRTLRVQGAEQLAQAALADVNEVRLQQQSGALSAYYEVLATQQRVRTLSDIAASATRLAQVARLRLQAGDLSVQDQTRMAIESERAEADLQAAQQDLAQAQTQLADWTALPRPGSGWQIAGPWPAAQALPVDARLQEWVERRADVQAARARVSAAQAGLASAQALRVPDPSVGTSIDQLPGTGAGRQLSLRLSIPLNTSGRFDSDIARAQAQLDQAQAQLEQSRLRAHTELQSLLQIWRSQSERLRRYEQDILPPAQKVATQAELAYSKGGLSLTDLLDARRTLRSLELEALQVRKDHALAQSQWQLRTHP